MALIKKHAAVPTEILYPKEKFRPGDIVSLNDGSYYRYIPKGYLKHSALAELKAPTGSNFIYNLGPEWHSDIDPIIDNNENRISIDTVWRPNKPWKYTNKESMKITLGHMEDSRIIWQR